MGFLKRLFKRKKGGTRVGNFLRQLGHNNTYGILGEDLGKSYGEILAGDNMEAQEIIDSSFQK